MFFERKICRKTTKRRLYIKLHTAAVLFLLKNKMPVKNILRIKTGARISFEDRIDMFTFITKVRQIIITATFL